MPRNSAALTCVAPVLFSFASSIAVPLRRRPWNSSRSVSPSIVRLRSADGAAKSVILAGWFCAARLLIADPSLEILATETPRIADLERRELPLLNQAVKRPLGDLQVLRDLSDREDVLGHR